MRDLEPRVERERLTGFRVQLEAEICNFGYYERRRGAAGRGMTGVELPSVRSLPFPFRGRLIGRPPDFGSGYPGSSPGPGTTSLPFHWLQPIQLYGCRAKPTVRKALTVATLALTARRQDGELGRRR